MLRFVWREVTLYEPRHPSYVTLFKNTSEGSILKKSSICDCGSIVQIPSKTHKVDFSSVMAEQSTAQLHRCNHSSIPCTLLGKKLFNKNLIQNITSIDERCYYLPLLISMLRKKKHCIVCIRFCLFFWCLLHLCYLSWAWLAGLWHDVACRQAGSCWP